MHAGGPPHSSTTPVQVNQYKEVVQEDLGKKLLPEVMGMLHGAENNTSCSINNTLAAEEEPPPLQTLPNKVAELEEEEGKQQQQQHCESYTQSQTLTPLIICCKQTRALEYKQNGIAPCKQAVQETYILGISSFYRVVYKCSCCCCCHHSSSSSSYHNIKQ
jgi:hypothetical protein